MPIFQCPSTGENIAVPFGLDPEAGSDVYELVRCPACAFDHLLNKATGSLLSESVEKNVGPYGDGP